VVTLRLKIEENREGQRKGTKMRWQRWKLGKGQTNSDDVTGEEIN
jgi:hypothetical protein